MNETITIASIFHKDSRGYNSILYDTTIATQLPADFHVVQINQGFSKSKYTLRGLHYQLEPHAQAKLCYCLTGSVYNVALNLETGEAVGEVLKPGTAMFIPRGYAHGYLTLEDNTLFQWCVDNGFASDAARILHYNSVDSWPAEPVIISEKDRNGVKWPG
jgi:dTDP-4-dehydrorhamnose 3,5-epimerase